MSIIETTLGLSSLRSALAGSLALPGEDGYELATPWNVAVPVRPAAVVSAADAQDVTETVRFAAAHGLRVAVQRTGHGAVPLGDDVILVHTGRLTELSIDAGAGRARMGAGLVWQQVMDAAAAHGLAPLAGAAPGVGVVGFLTGGGIGPLSRTAGLSSDRVLAFDLVTGDGRQLRVTPDEHPELFWGLRGGKGTLGIVTAVELELLPIAEVYGGAVYFDGDDAAAVLHAWRSWTDDLPEHANTSVALLQLPPLPAVPPPLAGRLTVAVRYTSTAGEAEAAALLAPIRAVATPLIDTAAMMPSAAIGAVHADPVDPMPTSESSALLRELPVEAVEALLQLAGPGARSPQVCVELRLLGGALARPGEHPNAFCHRDAAYNLCTVGVLAPPIAAAVVAPGAAGLTAQQSWATRGAGPHVAPSADPARITRCYDQETRIRLARLAEDNDPDGVLQVGQVVR